LKYIIFDFGNVLYDLDIAGCISRFKSIANLPEQSAIPDIFRSACEQYERGELSDEGFIWHLQQFNPSVNPRLLVDVWNSMLVGISQETLDMLVDLKSMYTVCLLRNINALHARAVERYVLRTFDESNFLSRYFDYSFYSHQIGMRKPEQRIFAHVTEQLGAADLSQILFIDDLPVNVEAAKVFGWKAKVHDPSIPISRVIDSYLAEANT
jgi:glucose-1-phosphatase